MITNADIAKLAKVLATKEDIKALDERLTRVEETVSSSSTVLDGLVKDVKYLKDENLVLKHHLKLL